MADRNVDGCGTWGGRWVDWLRQLDRIHGRMAGRWRVTTRVLRGAEGVTAAGGLKHGAVKHGAGGSSGPPAPPAT